MVKILNQSEASFESDFDVLLQKREKDNKIIEKSVSKILNDVKKKRDSAVLKYTQKLDNFRIKEISEILVSKHEIESGMKSIDKTLIKSMEHAADRIKSYHKKQFPKNLIYRDKKGIILGGIWNPIESVGLYVPGGKAAYPSTVLMNAIPAIVAGVERIAVTVPVNNGKINPLVLGCLKILNINEIYKIGGAQAIGALTYGTETIKKVDKIFGPGNAYVAAAKKQVFGDVGIDMIAGPSEILVLADENNNPEHIAIDLLSQAEHDPLAQSILVTDNIEFSKKVELYVNKYLAIIERKKIARQSWNKHGAIIIVNSLTDACKFINLLAPEHLELSINKASEYLKKIRNAGAIFLGKFTPEAIGDYIAGPNHVLPTDRTARFSSGLNLLDFFKRTSVVKCSKTNLKLIGPDAIMIANEEGLQAHALSIECRLKNF